MIFCLKSYNNEDNNNDVDLTENERLFKMF